MTKKRILFILLAMVLAVSVGLIGCGGGQQEEEEEEEEEEPIEVLYLTFSDHNPGGPGFNPIATAMDNYLNYINDNSGGKVNITGHYLGSLYSNVELFDAVKGGACDGGSYAPEQGDGMYYHQVMTLPFMGFPERTDAQDIYWQIYADFPEIPAEFTDNDCMIGPGTYFMMPKVQMHFYAENLIVDEPADVAGMEMVVMEGIYDPICSALGIIPNLLDFPGLVPAFQTGMGDGFIQHSEFLWGALGKEFFKSHTLVEGGILILPMGHLWNKAKYEECLAIVGQQVMDAAGALYLQTCVEGSNVDTAAITQYFADEGHTVTELDTAQTQAFQSVLTPYHDEWIADAPDPAKAQAIYDAVLAAIAAL